LHRPTTVALSSAPSAFSFASFAFVVASIL
jgi:hypothetical protein